MDSSVLSFHSQRLLDLLEVEENGMNQNILGLSANNFRYGNSAESNSSPVYKRVVFSIHHVWFWVALKEMQSFQKGGCTAIDQAVNTRA